MAEFSVKNAADKVAKDWVSIDPNAFFGSPAAVEATANALEKIDQVVGKKSSNTIKSIEKQEGYSFIEIAGSRQAGRGASFAILEKVFRRRQQAASHEGEVRFWDDVITFLGNPVTDPGLDSYNVTEFNLIYKTGSGGSAKVLSLYFQRREDGRYDFASVDMAATMELAPTMIIRSHHKKSFLSEKSWDSIEYVPTPITDKHISDIMMKLLPSLAVSTGHLAAALPDITPQLALVGKSDE